MATGFVQPDALAGYYFGQLCLTAERGISATHDARTELLLPETIRVLFRRDAGGDGGKGCFLKTIYLSGLLHIRQEVYLWILSIRPICCLFTVVKTGKSLNMYLSKECIYNERTFLSLLTSLTL